MLRQIDLRFRAQEDARSANHEQVQHRLEKLEESAKLEAGEWQRVEREFLQMQRDMALQYVRREDYIRGQSVVEAKLDGLAVKIENLQLREYWMENKMQIDLARSRRESLRWLILLTLNNARPIGAFEARFCRWRNPSIRTPRPWNCAASSTTCRTVTWSGWRSARTASGSPISRGTARTSPNTRSTVSLALLGP